MKKVFFLFRSGRPQDRDHFGQVLGGPALNSLGLLDRIWGDCTVAAIVDNSKSVPKNQRPLQIGLNPIRKDALRIQSLTKPSPSCTYRNGMNSNAFRNFCVGTAIQSHFDHNSFHLVHLVANLLQFIVELGRFRWTFVRVGNGAQETRDIGRIARWNPLQMDLTSQHPPLPSHFATHDCARKCHEFFRGRNLILVIFHADEQASMYRLNKVHRIQVGAQLWPEENANDNSDLTFVLLTNFVLRGKISQRGALEEFRKIVGRRAFHRTSENLYFTRHSGDYSWNKRLPQC